MNSFNNLKIGIIGLGYVGLPLAVEFGKKIKTVGFDINQTRIDELQCGNDSTLEVTHEELAESTLLTYSSQLCDLKDCNVYIVTVPTPIDENNRPDLSPLIKASEQLAKIICKNDIVVYESTVFPGATEDVCIPIIESNSGLTFNRDFYAGYSPERINPGDKKHRLVNIKKVTSGSTEKIAEFVDSLYNFIITAGTHKAPSIKVAEASKVIENVQRDVNIALVNELHQIFTEMNIDTIDVIEAASTKWNFMKLKPGLVGGHCISVDPYYLLEKSKSCGYIPDLIRKSREINNGMPKYIAMDFVKKLISKKINPVNCKVLLSGFTFKENCPDLRNTKSYELYLELLELGMNVKIFDPWVNLEEVKSEYDIDVLTTLKETETFDATIITVGHQEIIEEFSKNDKKYKDLYIYDFKGIL
nr:nucleotide sugar dehydrogenase [Vibrio lentus]